MDEASPLCGSPGALGRREPRKATEGDAAVLVLSCLLSPASQVPVLLWVCADPRGPVCRDSRSCFRIGYCIAEGWSSEDRRHSSGERLLVSHTGSACRTAPSQQQDLAEHAAAPCRAACASTRASGLMPTLPQQLLSPGVLLCATGWELVDGSPREVTAGAGTGQATVGYAVARGRWMLLFMCIFES